MHVFVYFCGGGACFKEWDKKIENAHWVFVICYQGVFLFFKGKNNHSFFLFDGGTTEPPNPPRSHAVVAVAASASL